MNRDRVTVFEWFSLQMMVLPMISHFLLTRWLVITCGRDAWIATLLSLVPASLFAWLLHQVRRKCQRKPLFMQLVRTSPVWGRVVIVLFVLYALILVFISFRAVELVMTVMFYPETPAWAIGLLLYLMLLVALTKNMTVLAQCSTLLFLLITFTGTITGLNLHSEKEYVNLLPMLDHGWGSLKQGVVLMTGSWAELLFSLQVVLKKRSEHQAAKGMWLCIGMSGLLAVSSMIAIIAIYGVSLARQTEWHMLESTFLLKYGFFDRVDVYGMYTVLFSAFVRVVYFMFITKSGLSTLFGKKWMKYAFYPLTLVPYLGSILTHLDDEMFFVLVRTVYEYSVYLLGVPLILLVLLRNSQKKRQNDEPLMSEETTTETS